MHEKLKHFLYTLAITLCFTIVLMLVGLEFGWRLFFAGAFLYAGVDLAVDRRPSIFIRTIVKEN